MASGGAFGTMVGQHWWVAVAVYLIAGFCTVFARMRRFLELLEEKYPSAGPERMDVNFWTCVLTGTPIWPAVMLTDDADNRARFGKT
jgi:hypothetical protein